MLYTPFDVEQLSNASSMGIQHGQAHGPTSTDDHAVQQQP
jgi:hypothetical protein